MKVIPKIKPRVRIQVSKPCSRLCETCAYKATPTEDEEEAELVAFVERGNKPHLCHNDHDFYCRGSWEFTKKLGLRS